MDQFHFLKAYGKARKDHDAQVVIEAIPYAKFLGIEALMQDGKLIFKLPPRKTNIGNPTLPAIHGGAVAGFMELAAVIYLLMEWDIKKLAEGQPKVPKVVNFSVDYIRACRFEDTYASCDMVRQGRKMANLGVQIWQKDPAILMATARAHYLLD
ncbi:MAG: PaaI family thioesterase [Cellvibrionaceae bacterium]